MDKRFFTQEQYDALLDATKGFEVMMKPRGSNTDYASQKSDMTIIEDLYRAILRNYNLPQDKFVASSVGWTVMVEKPFKVTVDWHPQTEENYGWTMNHVNF